MGAAMMRYGSDLYLTAALSGLIVMLLLLGAILVRSAEKGDQLITVSKHSENGGRALDIGVADLRGSLP